MPDEHGNIRGIRVPRVPWHEEEAVTAAERDEAERVQRQEFVDVELAHDPYGIGNPD